MIMNEITKFLIVIILQMFENKSKVVDHSTRLPKNES